ncbi:MAG: NERD domain-containing protein [Gammaproteobacteria bacterium]|nr:NERD domain-containing protein [Gammaproteobacteria bacterium]
MSSFAGQPRWLIAVAALLAVTLAVAVFVALWKVWRRRRARRRRDEIISGIALDHVRNVLVPDGSGGMLHLDWLLLTPRGLLLLEVRHVAGNVFGSDQMAEWTVMRGAWRSTFANPLGALYDRMAVIRRLVPELPVDGRIVLIGDVQFPKGVPPRCLRLESLNAEFPATNLTAAAGLAAGMQSAWQRLLGQLTPNPTTDPKEIV